MHMATQLILFGVDVYGSTRPDKCAIFEAYEEIAVAHVRGCKEYGTASYEKAAMTFFSAAWYCEFDGECDLLEYNAADEATVDRRLAVMYEYSLGTYIMFFCRCQLNYIRFTDRLLGHIDSLAKKFSVTERGDETSKPSALPPLPPQLNTRDRKHDANHGNKSVEQFKPTTLKWKAPRPRPTGAIPVGIGVRDDEEKRHRISEAVMHARKLKHAEETRIEYECKRSELRRLGDCISRGIG